MFSRQVHWVAAVGRKVLLAHFGQCFDKMLDVPSHRRAKNSSVLSAQTGSVERFAAKPKALAARGWRGIF